MNTLDVKQIIKMLKKNLDKNRFRHSLGVAHTAMALAMCYGQDFQKAEIAGLLHDCAKCIDDKEKIRLCKQHNIIFTKLEKDNPYLLHGKLGSYIACKEYGVNDKDIKNAIKYHTTGRENMGLIEKILFVADYIEPSRKESPDLKLIRQEAFQDLDVAVTHILGDTLTYLYQNKSKAIHPGTKMAYDFYKRGLGK